MSLRPRERWAVQSHSPRARNRLNDGRNGVSAQSPGAGPSLLRRGSRVLWRFISLHPLPFTAAVSGSVVYAITSVLRANVLGRLTDRVIQHSFPPHDDVQASTVWFFA